MNSDIEHLLDWNDRLQDWLDGDAEGAAAAQFETHLAQCTLCQQRVSEFERLDAALGSAAPRISLDERFDQRILAQIDSSEKFNRAEARRRAEQELQQNLRALSRGWRRALGFVVPGVIAGIAIALALSAWLDDSGLTRTLAAQGVSQLGADPLGRAGFDVIQVSLTALLGASLGLLVARWLAGVAE
jgi:anti-sigma factor RsiW